MANLNNETRTIIKSALTYTDPLIKEAAYMGFAFGLVKEVRGDKNPNLRIMSITDGVGELVILDRNLFSECLNRAISTYDTIDTLYTNSAPVSNFLNVFGLIDTIGLGIIDNINQHIDYFNRGRFAASMYLDSDISKEPVKETY